MKGKLTKAGVVKLLRKGYGASEIDAHFGVSHRSTETFIARHHLHTENYGLVSITNLAPELGVSRQALYYRAGEGDFELEHWGKRRCVTEAVAGQLRQMYDAPKRSEYPDWLTLRQAAPLVGVAPATLYKMLEEGSPKFVGIRSVKALGISGKTYLLCPTDIPLLSKRIGRKALPNRYRSRFTVPQLADLINVPETRLAGWSRKGCPHLEDRCRRYWFDLAEVRHWLASGVIRPRDLGGLLTRFDELLAPTPLKEAA